MSIYKLGSSGPEVAQIQSQLAIKNLYRGPLDGAFGGGTEAAVKAFQRANDLVVDGIVGAGTWRKLFETASVPQPFPAPRLPDEPIENRCLALTGAFETGSGPPDCFAGISGDFDDQGLSFGVCQWNFGQHSLQPLLIRMFERHEDQVRAIFQDHYDVLVAALRSAQDELMAFARSIQDPKHNVNEPWRGMFKALGRTDEFEQIEVEAAGRLLDAARALCNDYGLRSQRGLALMFDIKVQNGSIGDIVTARILKDFSALPAGLSGDALELEKMRIVAVRRAEASNPRWVDDVRVRKLCIANGGGRVHGIDYDLERQFGIGLATFAAPIV